MGDAFLVQNIQLVPLSPLKLQFDGVNDRVDFNSTLSITTFPFDLTYEFKLTNETDNIFISGRTSSGVREGFESGITSSLLSMSYYTGTADTSSTRRSYNLAFNFNLNQKYTVTIKNFGLTTTPEAVIDGVTYTIPYTSGTGTGSVRFSTARYQLFSRYLPNDPPLFTSGILSYFKVTVNNIDVHEYLVDEGSGQVLNDNIGNVNGTIIGATWIQI
jgi:hypothetical protein